MKNQKDQIQMNIKQAHQEGIKAFQAKITSAPANNENFMVECEKSTISNETLWTAYGYAFQVARLAEGQPKNSSIVNHLNRIS